MMPRIYKYDHLAPVTIQRRDLHETAVKFAEDEFARKGAAPFMWLFASGMHVAWIETPWEDLHEKQLSTEFMRETMRSVHAHAYAFISEVWMAATGQETDPKKVKAMLKQADKHGVSSLPPSQRDDMLLIMTFDRDGGFDMTRYLVTLRGPGRGLSFLGPRMDVDPGELRLVEGRMWNLLADDPK